jgi:hypothetical protein
MMNVLLANVRLWSGRMNESLARGGEAIALFQEIGDRWGEVMATGPVVRALAELGRDTEYADTLAHYRTIGRDMPDEGMRTFPEVMEALVDLQQGRPEAAQAILETLDLAPDEGQLGSADGCAALGLARLQLGKVDDAIDVLARGYAEVAEDGPVMAIGCRLALAYAAARRPGDALAVVAELQARTGGSFSDRMFAQWADAFARTQSNAPDAREPADAAYALAVGTDAPLEHAIAALARARVLAALGTDDADDAADDATMQLDALGLTADGWLRIFDLALAGVSVPS